MDDVGEWATTTYGTGRGNRVELTHEIRFPHSLGLIYSAFTYFTGFRVNSGEYKLMGLAPYGEPRYADGIREHLIDLKDDGSFRLDLSYFRYCEGLRMTSPKFDALFGGPPRRPETSITQREMDIAASVQAALFIWHQLLGHPRTVRPHDAQQGSLLGPHWSDDEIQVFLDSVDAPRDDYADDVRAANWIERPRCSGMRRYLGQF